ncbi:MAG: hypothetical protein V1774_00175 [Candidatus Eisenbacteria bacterium]
MKTMVLILLIGLALVAGCSDDPVRNDPDPQEEAPALPSVGTMEFDVSFFDGISAPAAWKLESPDPCPKANWLNALVRVAVVNLIVNAGLTPPTVAFQAATHTIPSYLGDLTWLWIYTWVDGAGREYQVRLTGEIADSAVEWEMRARSEDTIPVLDDALWFLGRSPIGYGEGYWILHDIARVPSAAAVRIDYEFAGDADRELRFENILEGNEGFGDVLTYEAEGSLRMIEFHDASAGAECDITWDEETGAGRLQCPDYGAGDPACWDEAQCDVDCPPAVAVASW